MKAYLPSFALAILYLRPALGIESVTLPPDALKAVVIAGDTTAPTIAVQNVGASYQIRARDFGTGPVRDDVVYLRFDLSSLKKTTLQTASITFNKVAGDTLATGRFALFGLADVPGNLAQDWTASSFAYGAEFDPSLASDAIASSGACPVNLSNVVDLSTQEIVSGNAATLNSRAYVATQNTAYNQPPHPSFFIGNNMPAVATPKVFVSPVPDFIGRRNPDGDFKTSVLVVLNVNQSRDLRNEYRIDGGTWLTYREPFVLAHQGTHTLVFRTMDNGGNVLAEAARFVTLDRGKHHDHAGDDHHCD